MPHEDSTVTVLLVRHAKAGKRSEWTGPDDERPLTKTGHKQAQALRDMLAEFQPKQLYSAPRVRCVDTIAPLAEAMGLEIQHEMLFSEEGYWPNPRATEERLLELAHDGPLVMSSQGGVIPDLVARLAIEHQVALSGVAGLEVPSPLGASALGNREVPSPKGSVWRLEFRASVLVSGQFLDNPVS